MNGSALSKLSRAVTSSGAARSSSRESVAKDRLMVEEGSDERIIKTNGSAQFSQSKFLVALDDEVSSNVHFHEPVMIGIMS